MELQRQTYVIAEARFRAGRVSELDVDQAEATLARTEAALPRLDMGLRQANNRLCILLGIPPRDLTAMLGEKPLPTAPAALVVGIPADLLRRRPDVRRAERLIQAQSAKVGIAVAELYPHIGINGTLAFSAENLDELFTPQALQSGVGPFFSWNVLNYGRLLNNIRLQDAKLAEQRVIYQNLVLRANAEAENGIAAFLRGRQQVEHLQRSVLALEKATKVAIVQYQGGIIDFNWVAYVEEILVEQEEMLAAAQGETLQGLVELYRALGGGWQHQTATPLRPDLLRLPP